MVTLSIIFASLVACEFIYRCGAKRNLSELIKTAVAAYYIIFSKKISDHWKERALLIYAGKIFLNCFKLLFIILIIVIIITLPVEAMAWLLKIRVTFFDLLLQWYSVILMSGVALLYSGARAYYGK